MNKCPKCNRPNEDNWPLDEGDGGCEECWEAECSREWWEMIGRLEQVYELRQILRL